MKTGKPATGVCPVCNGTKILREKDPVRDKYTYSFDGKNIGCTNCGGQYMSLQPTGTVRLDKNGEPCRHNYSYKSLGRCYHSYTCINCNDSYSIDSGD